MSDTVTLWTVAHQAPLSMGILQARILEWVPMPSSRELNISKRRTHNHAGHHADKCYVIMKKYCLKYVSAFI